MEVLFSIIGIMLPVILIISEWKILIKAGEKGWKVLIPFYNIYVSHHVLGMSHIWFILEVLVWSGELITEIIEPGFDLLTTIFLFSAGIFTVISEIIHMLKLGQCFGKNAGFKLGLILLPEVFMPIIAFGKSQYQKPNHKKT